MKINGLIEYTKNEIERKARETLRARPDIQFSAPIRIELLLENTQNVFLETQAAMVTRFSVEGVTCTKDFSPNRIVLVDQNIADSSNDMRYNAVIGEEFAHICIHEALIMQVKSIEDFLEIQQHEAWPRFELDARHFSEAIRMPPELVIAWAEKIYPRIVDSTGFGDAGVVDMTMAREMAMVFCVSIDEMRRRLLNFPCEITRRVQASVLACSATLFPSDSISQVFPAASQRYLPEFD